MLSPLQKKKKKRFSSELITIMSILSMVLRQSCSNWDCEPLVPSVCDTLLPLSDECEKSVLLVLDAVVLLSCCVLVCVLPVESVCDALVANLRKSSIRVCGNSLLKVMLELSALVSDVLFALDSFDCVPLDFPLDSFVLVESISCRMSEVMKGSNLCCALKYN